MTDLTAFLSVGVIILIQILTFVFNQGKMASRHEENQRRFHRIELALGIESGQASFLTRAEATILMQQAERHRDEIDRRLDEYDRRFDALEEDVRLLKSR